MFDTENLNVLSYANKFTLWHYKTEDDMETVRAPNYFSEVKDILCENDFIFINAADSNFIAFILVSKDKLLLCSI